VTAGRLWPWISWRCWWVIGELQQTRVTVVQARRQQQQQQQQKYILHTLHVCIVYLSVNQSLNQWRTCSSDYRSLYVLWQAAYYSFVPPYTHQWYPPPHWRWGLVPIPRFFFNFWVSNCIFWCTIGAILSATLLNSTGQRANYGVLGGMVSLPPKSAYSQPHSRAFMLDNYNNNNNNYNNNNAQCTVHTYWTLQINESRNVCCKLSSTRWRFTSELSPVRSDDDLGDWNWFSRATFSSPLDLPSFVDSNKRKFRLRV